MTTLVFTVDNIRRLAGVLHPQTTVQQMTDLLAALEDMTEPAPAPASRMMDGAEPIGPARASRKTGPADLPHATAAPEAKDNPASAAQSRANRAAPRHGRAWTKTEDNTLIKLHAEGVDANEIAVELRRTVKVVRSRISALKAARKVIADQTTAPEKGGEGQSDVVTGAASTPPKERSPRAPAPAAAAPIGTKAGVAAPRPTDQTVALNALERAVQAHLAGLSQDDFTPDDDFHIARMVIDRQDFRIICDDLGCDADAVKRRWTDLRALPEITTPKGHLTIDGQAALMKVLRLRADA